MNSKGLSNFLIVLCILTVAISTYFTIDAVDRLRFEMENIRGKLESNSVAVQPVMKNSVPTPDALSPAVPAANVQFFDPNAQSGGKITDAVAADTQNLNTLINNDSYVSTLWSKAMDTLAERNYKNINKFEPLLAESWTRSDDGLSYRVKLREGILWHDFTDPVSGKKWTNVPVTSHDFKFYVDVVKNPKVDAAPTRTYMRDLDRIEVINDREFLVVWKKKYFLSGELTLALSPLPRHLYHAYPGPFDPEKFNTDHVRNRMLVGCGPYRVDKWEKGQRITLKRWEKYYGKKLGIMPPIEKLVFEVIPHPNTRFQSLLSKNLDSLSLTPEQWVKRTSSPEFSEKGHLIKLKYPALVYNYIGFNFRTPVFQDRATRVALSHLVDKDRIVKDVYYNLARPVTGPFFPDGPANDPSLKNREFSIELARKMLADAGWKDIDHDGILERNGQKLKFTLMYPNANPVYPRMLPMIKEDMAKAGVQMDLLGLEWSVCLQRLEKKKFEACAMGWAGGINPDPYQLWHSSQADLDGSSNMIHFANPEADRLIEAIRTEFDEEKRVKLYHQFHKLLYDEAPYIFLVSPYSLAAYNRNFRNLNVFPLGVPNQILWLPRAGSNP